MDILKSALEWTRIEIISSSFFIIFGLLFVIAGIGCWQLGKTELAKAYFIPALVAGALLLIIGIGLVYANKTRMSTFPSEYKKNPSVFVQSEIERAEKTIQSYNNAVFRVIPVIIVIASLVVMFIDKPLWRAIGIVTIAMMVVILLIDSNAQSRMKEYKQELVDYSSKK
jgi:xanthine/uracil permease